MKKIRAIVCNHMDLTWRRPFDRDMEFHGQNFVSYAKLEEYYILDNLKFAREYPDYKFTIESVEVVRKFLERNPMYEAELKQLYAEGRIHTLFTGNNIVDSNMSSGESIIRNFLYGKRWMKQHMNQESGVCMRTDAFGNSAQLPQIVRGFGCKYIGRICYSTCDGNYWRGLDGSTVVTKPFQIVFESGGYYKYRPCPKCNGYGCKVCRYRGIDEEYIQKQIIPMSRMDTSKITGDPLEYILCGGEELMPRRDILTFREEHKDDLEVVFSSYEDLYREIDLSRVDNPPEEEVASSVEMNTNNTGTYATRIRMKQRLRNCESALFTAENLESQYALATGKAHTEKLEAIWRQVNFTMFHDAVPATHVDAAYAELMDTFDWIEEEVHALNDENKQLFIQPKEQALTVYNPSANAVERELMLDGDDWTADEEKLIWANGRYLVKLTAYEALDLHRAQKKRDVETQKLGRQILSEGTSILTDVEIKTQAVEELNDAVIENGRYRITAGLHGIREIFDKKLGYAIAKEEEYCPFGFLLEHDDGSPWATMSSDLRRTSLKKDTILEAIEHGEGYERLKFKIALPDRVIAYSVTGVDISYDVTIYHDFDKIYMNCRVFWDTINHRLRIAMPLTITGQDVYEIPYGWLERKEYGLTRFREGRENWAGSINDYPAMNWAGVQAGQCGVFLFNQGTPSHYITNNQNGGRTIFVTPLRSPNNATYLHDPAAYSMTDWDGMRDAGIHEFSYMLESFAGNRTQKYAVLAGAGFTATPLVTEGEFQPLELPVLTGDSARISSIKCAEDDDALIVRMVEINGEKTQISMRVPDWAASVELTDLNEHTTNGLEIVNGMIQLQFHPFEIKTVKLKIKR